MSAQEQAWGLVVSVGGQIPQNLAKPLHDRGARVRCGWLFARARVHRGVAPPSWYWVLCSGCSPGLRARLKREAEEKAHALRGTLEQ